MRTDGHDQANIRFSQFFERALKKGKDKVDADIMKASKTAEVQLH
jgi:hypothetical protein